MRYEDWRLSTTADLLPLLEAERRRWLEDLGWDISAGLAAAEQGRRTGRVPGFLARGPDGRPAGWTFFSVDRGTLSLGVLIGDRADVVRELLDLSIEAPEAAFARRYQVFLFPRAAAVGVALARRRFDVAPQRFLVRPVAPPSGPPEGVGRGWREEDLPDVVRLLARAYAGTPASAAFAPDGRLEEWAAYLGQVTRSSACGTFLPQATVIVAGERPDRPAGALLVTTTSEGVWHVAQVAVDPACRRTGLARRMVTAVCHAAGAAGARELTLVVDERNQAARALYAGLGFFERSVLLFGARPRLTRVQAADTAALATPAR